MRQSIRFVGGPQDGQLLEVPQPVFPGMELHVRLADPCRPSMPYRLAGDGTFHFEPALLACGDDESTRARSAVQRAI